MSTMEVQKLSLKYKKLKKYFPAEILYSHFHNTKSVFLDSSLKNKYGKYSVIGLYPYLEVKESNNILKINDKETKGNLLDFLDSYIKENKQGTSCGNVIYVYYFGFIRSIW